MGLFSRMKVQMPEPGGGAARARPGDAGAGPPLRARHPARAAVPGAASSWPCSAWAASGAPRRSSGRRRASITTAVGYAGGYTPNPTYDEVCSARTGHNEVVRVVFDPAAVTLRGDAEAASGRATTRPRACARATTWAPSTARAIYMYSDAQRRGRGGVARRVPGAPHGGRPRARSPPRSRRAAEFYYAEDYHQQYLAKVPNGYCGLGGTGVSCPIGLQAVAQGPCAAPPRRRVDPRGGAPTAEEERTGSDDLVGKAKDLAETGKDVAGCGGRTPSAGGRRPGRQGGRRRRQGREIADRPGEGRLHTATHPGREPGPG